MSANIKVDVLDSLGSAITFSKLDVGDVFRWKNSKHTCIKTTETRYIFYANGGWQYLSLSDIELESFVEFAKSATLSVEW